MLQSSLTFQGEHEAWRQRVNKEVGNSQKFQGVTEMAMDAGETNGFTNTSGATMAVHPYHRSNINRNALKQGNYYMVDSTYLVASNPNTMRDQGPCRNAEYHFRPSTSDGRDAGLSTNGFATFSYQNPQNARKQFVKQKGNKEVQNVIDHRNRGVYSYGGKTKIGGRFHHKNAHHALVDYEPSFTRTATRWNQSVDCAKTKISKELHYKVNDYQKNISQNIFSPGKTIEKTPKKIVGSSKARRRLTGQRRSINVPENMKAYKPQRENAFQLGKTGSPKKFNDGKSTKTYKSAHSLSRKLDKERR